MAAGDVFWFDQALADCPNGVHKLGSDTVKLGLIKGTVAPTMADPNPCWGSGGGTNLSTNAVAAGVKWTGPVTLTNVTSGLSGGKYVFGADNVDIDQDVSGFTDARWGVIYNDTQAQKKAIAFVDLGSDRSIQSGPLTIKWNVGGILTIDQSVTP